MLLRPADVNQTRLSATVAYACRPAAYTYPPAADLRRYEGKLHAVTTDFPGETSVTYEYGGDGKRRSRVSEAEETWYNWDREWNVVSEEDDADGSSGALSRTYIAGADTIEQVESILADVGGTSPATGDYRYYALDHLGSVRGLYDGTKSAVAAAEYEPYGGVYAESGVAMPYSFTGKPYDGASGLHYFPYRYYSSEQMRWIMRDPAETVDGPNVYLYLAASPMNMVDRMGLAACNVTPEFAAGACIAPRCGIDGLYFLVPQYFFGADFQNCCCQHDRCFGGCVRNPTQNQISQRGECDFCFLRCLVQECSRKLWWHSRLRKACNVVVVGMYIGVRTTAYLCENSIGT